MRVQPVADSAVAGLGTSVPGGDRSLCRQDANVLTGYSLEVAVAGNSVGGDMLSPVSGTSRPRGWADLCRPDADTTGDLEVAVTGE
ncbi:hypothetical protein HS125_06180 [bacterium]|nr:hypothetical protein [bacterium]